MAIPMPIVQDIRRLDRQGMSRAQIARRLHVDRGTVAKYADMEDCSPKPKADRRYGSKIDPYAHLVDEWLEADRLLPRKQRHTIRRVHDRLLAETDYDGEYSTTMRYVHRWREANRGVPDREGYVRLEWAAGSMQVDFGVARARIAGEMADVHCLVVSLPYSNMRLCVALPGENAECLCHGLMLVFEHIGGVPPVIVMDNATGAGRRNAKGEVALTGVFSAFVAHYRLEVRFCNPYSGNEKGSRLLFQIISDSYETRSIIYTTNIEFSGWGRVLGDKNMAAALIDRTVHHGRLIRFEGRSYRSEHALMTK